ncbi:MAG: class I SAM-dependent methyltransferase [Methanomicrobiales archaeon]
MQELLIFKLFEGIPRQGPGSDLCTEKMFSLVPVIPNAPEILDIGCGTGAQTLTLARIARNARVTAVDVYTPYLATLKKKAEENGLSNRITTICASMDDLPLETGYFDIIWAEGSVFVMGFSEGIRYWKNLLKPGGYLALSEMVWFTDTPSYDTREFFREQYPAMTTITGNTDMVNAAGYTLLSSFSFPASVWWDNYYIPLEKRLDEFERMYTGNDEAMALVEVLRKEIALFRDHSTEYGYQFFLLKN